MKKLVVCVMAIVACISCIFLVNDKEEDYLRLHIRANSNSEYDQNIKYDIKSVVVKALVPIAEGVDNKDDMMSVLEQNLAVLTQIVDNRLSELGLEYRSNIKVCSEEFPTRSYEELTLGAGV